MCEGTVHMNCEAEGGRSTVVSPAADKALSTSYWAVNVDHAYAHPILAKRGNKLPPLQNLLPMRLLRTAIDRKVFGDDTVIYVAFVRCVCAGMTRLRHIADNVSTLFRERDHGKHIRLFALATTNKVEQQGESRCVHHVTGELVGLVRSLAANNAERDEMETWKFVSLSEAEYSRQVKEYADGMHKDVKIVSPLGNGGDSDGSSSDGESDS